MQSGFAGRIITNVIATHERPAAERIAADPDFGGQLVSVAEFDRPSGNDDAITAQSIAWMFRLSNSDKSSKPVRDAAIAVIGECGYARSAKEIADAIFRWVKRRVHYEHEDAMHTPFTDFARFQVDQTLIAPAALLRMPQPEGDCVDFSMLTAALCRLFGMRTAYKTIAADPDSNDYSHVYVVIELQPGAYYPLDTSNGPAPGTEFNLPRGKKSRLWWNPERPVMVNRRPSRRTRGMSPRMAMQLQGLGYLDDEGNYVPDPTDTSGIDDSSLDTLPLVSSDPNSILAASAGVPDASSSPSSSTNPFTTIATTVVNDASQALAPLIRQSTIKAPYYITGANGAQILYDPSTGQVVNAPGGIAGGNLNTLLLWGIGIGAALMLASAFAHK